MSIQLSGNLAGFSGLPMGAGVTGICERFFDAPSSPKPILDGLRFDTQTLRPNAQNESFSIELQKAVCTGIPCLFCFCSPSAISGFVITIGFNPINSELRGWAFAHICKEVLEIAPSVANNYSAPPVPWVRLVSRIVATPPHHKPTFVSERSGFSMRSVVVPFETDAAAAFCGATAQIAPGNLKATPAVAKTPPVVGAYTRRIHKQSFKPRARFNYCSHGFIISNLTKYCNSYFGLMGHANAWRERKQFAGLLRKHGHRVSHDLTRVIL